MMFMHLKNLAAEAFLTCAQECHKTVLFFENMKNAAHDDIPPTDGGQPSTVRAPEPATLIQHYIKQPR